MVTALAPEQILRDLLTSEGVRAAFRFFETRAREITDEQIAICSIPAPPFGEGERAAYLREKFRGLGLDGAQWMPRATV
jgi:transposase